MIYFKKISIVLILFLYININIYASLVKNETSFKTIFPIPSSLSEDDINWEQSNVSISEVSDGCVIYSTKYSYHGKNSKIKFGIHRDSSYFVDIRVFNCLTPPLAEEKYKYFKLISAKNKHSIQLEGDLRTNFFIIPGQVDDLKSDYYLNYLKDNFVIQAYSDDGFALVDISQQINKALDILISQRPKIKQLPSLKITISAKNYEPYSEILTINSSNTKINLHGAIYNDNYEPISEATVSIDSLGLKTKSDKNGGFEILHNKELNSSLSIFRNVYLDKDKNSLGALSSGLYFLNLTYNSFKVASPKIWKLNIDSQNQISGTALDNDKSYKISGSISDNVLKVILDCENLDFKKDCTQSYVGFITRSSIIGGFEGDMGEGSFVIHKNLFTKKIVKIKPSQNEITLKTLNLYPMGIGSLSEGDTILQSTNSNKTFLLININSSDLKKYNHNSHLYLTNINLILTRAASTSQEGDLPLYLYNYSDLNKETATTKVLSELGTLKNSSVNYEFKISLPYHEDKISRFLIGPTKYQTDETSEYEVDKINSSVSAPLLELVYYLLRADIDQASVPPNLASLLD